MNKVFDILKAKNMGLDRDATYYYNTLVNVAELTHQPEVYDMVTAAIRRTGASEMSEQYSFETKYEIWNDKTGYCIEVGPDRDGLDLIEIRSRDSHGHIDARFTMTRGQAVLIAKALNLLLAGTK